VEQLQLIVSLLHTAWFKEPHPKPIPVPRPGDGNGQRPMGELAEPPKMSSREEIRAFFGGGDGSIKVVYSES
jgi:hypothetical protein